MRQEELLRQVTPRILLFCSRAYSSMHPNFYQVQLMALLLLSRLTIILGKGNQKANMFYLNI